MKTVRFLLFAAALVVAMPAIANEAPEAPLDALAVDAAEAPTLNAEQAEGETTVVSPLEATGEADLQWLVGDDENAPLDFFGSTSCGSWQYAGCCNQSQTKFTRNCYDTSAPWINWTETRCQNGCLL